MFDLRRRPVNSGQLSWLTIGQKITCGLVPPVCALCGGQGQRADELWGIDLCVYCEAACTRPGQACPGCGEPGSPSLCPRCRDRPPPFDGVHALFHYEDPAARLVTRLKFGHELACGRILGTLLARDLRRCQPPRPDCIVPMPLHRTRYLERGFNQSREIARHVARRLGIRLEPGLLYRQRPTAPQSGLAAAARAANVAAAFAVVTHRSVPSHVALLDDVMTTGATCAAAALALRTAGAQQVEVWVCARAGRARNGGDGPRIYGE